MADENDNEFLTQIEKVKKRLKDAREKAAIANSAEELDAWNNEIDAAKLALENLVSEFAKKRKGAVNAETNTPSEGSEEKEQESKNGDFKGCTMTFGRPDDHIPSSFVDDTASDDVVEDGDLQKELKETKARLNKANSELGRLQEQHEGLKTRHDNLKGSVLQTRNAVIAEQKELQDKYDKAVDTAKTLAARIKELETVKVASENNIKDEKNELAKCEIIKLALAHLGHTAPENFKADSFYNTILNLYDFVKKDLLTRHNWKFALEREGLSPAGKIGGTSYFTYELPKKLLKIQKLVPNCDYEIMGNTLLCMADNAALYYIKYVEDVALPEFFKTLLVYSLAASSAALVTQNEVIARKWEIEANQRFCIAIANDTSQQAMHGVIRNPIYMSHFS